MARAIELRAGAGRRHWTPVPTIGTGATTRSVKPRSTRRRAARTGLRAGATMMAIELRAGAGRPASDPCPNPRDRGHDAVRQTAVHPEAGSQDRLAGRGHDDDHRTAGQDQEAALDPCPNPRDRDHDDGHQTAVHPEAERQDRVADRLAGHTSGTCHREEVAAGSPGLGGQDQDAGHQTSGYPEADHRDQPVGQEAERQGRLPGP